MKIAFLADAGTVHARRWSLGLASRGHDLHIFTNSSFGTFPDGITTELLPGKPPLAYFRNIPRIKKMLGRFAPDVVHAHYATGYGLWGYSQKAAPLIVTVWGTDIADALAGKLFIAPIVRRALKAARFVTSPSRFLLEQTARLEPSAADKLVLLPFGVPMRVDEETRRAHPGMVRVIFTKQFYPTYAPEMVVRAFAAACRRLPDLHLLMIGGGPLQSRLASLVGSLDLGERVEIKGWIDPDQAQGYIQDSDIMVMPSIMESFGVAAVEAAAAGIPVIATNVGGIPEIVEHGVNGLLIDVGDESGLTEAIITLAGDEARRRRMGSAGRQIAREKFNIVVSLNRLEDLYHQTLGR